MGQGLVPVELAASLSCTLCAEVLEALVPNAPKPEALCNGEPAWDSKFRKFGSASAREPSRTALGYRFLGVLPFQLAQTMKGSEQSRRPQCTSYRFRAGPQASGIRRPWSMGCEESKQKGHQSI